MTKSFLRAAVAIAGADQVDLVDALHVIVIVLVVIHVVVAAADGKTEANETVDAVGKSGGLLEGESQGEEGGLVEQPDQILDGLVGLVDAGLLAKRLDDGVGRVQLEGLLGAHVAGHAAIAEGLGLHDALHVGSPAVLTGDEAARGVHNAVGNDDLLDLVVEDLLHDLAQTLGLSLLLLEALLLLVGLPEVEPLLGGADELLVIVLLELLDNILVDRVHHVQDLVALALELLQEGRGLHGLLALTGDVVDAGLVLLHAGDVVLEGREVLARRGALVAEQLGELGAVGAVLVDTELQVLREVLLEFLVV